MSQIKKLRTKRAAHRIQAMKLVEKIDVYLEGSNIEINECEAMFESFSDKINTVKKLDAAIDELLKSETEISAEIIEVDEFHEKIVPVKIKLQNKLKCIQQAGPINIEDCKPIENKSKLPKLSLSKFYGEPAEYLDFWNQFENSVHKNPSLTEIDKFCYLKSLLGGKALASIKGLAITVENYSHAVKLISETFGQRDILINAHISNLLNINPVKNSSNIQGLRNLYFEAQTQIRCLEELEVQSETFTTVITNIILKNLPTDLTLEFSKQNIYNCHELKDLMKFLYESINAREKAYRIHSSSSPYNNSSIQYKQNTIRNIPKRYFNKGSQQMSATELLAKTSKVCLFCTQGHESTECENLTVQEKRDKLIREKRCLLCCNTNCFVRKCNGKPCTFCKYRHARAICFKLENSKGQKFDLQPKEKITENQTAVSNSVVNEKNGIWLQCVKTEIVGNKSSDIIIAMFDNGSEKSFIKRDVSKKLGLKYLGSETLKIYSFGTKDPRLQTCRRVEVRLRNILNGNERVIEALETDEITGATIKLPDVSMRSELKAKGFTLTWDCGEVFSDSEISLLIGSDFYWNLTKGFERLNSSLVAVNTELGWSVQGKCSDLYKPTSVNLVLGDQIAISDELRRFWELESLGIGNEETENLSIREKEIMQEFNNSIRMVEGRYCVKLPWKPGMREKLADNREMAYKRFRGLIRKFRGNPSFFEEYKRVVHGYLEEGIIEKSSIDSDSDSHKLSFYLPHHAVIREDKSTSRLRIVFDGASHDEGQLSINDCLFKGLNLYPSLFELLLKFRQNPIAFTADIKQAYLQILIEPCDRKFTKFFWTDDIYSDSLREMNFTRVMFGLKPSPFLLSATLNYHFEKYKPDFPNTCKLLSSWFYVDDLIGGEEELDAALRTTTESFEILKAAHMDLRKWKTNSQDLKERWRETNLEIDEHHLITEFETQHRTLSKVLGLFWDPDDDSISFDSTHLLKYIKTGTVTKRFVLQIVGRIFDPIGIVGPLIIRIKCILQELWTCNLDWDDELPESLSHKWQLWCSDVEHLKHIEIPRYYFSMLDCKLVSFNIHSFSDATPFAYGTVIYLRAVSIDSKIVTSLVCSKSRVAPLKGLTLPRLELMGALLSSRLTLQVSKCLKFDASCHFWTDSLITLYWIKGKSSKYKTFVKNRVEEIQSLSNPNDWAYCPGKENPADIISRGDSAANLAVNKMWWYGPPWLSQPLEFWPNESRDCKLENVDLELKKETIQNKCLVRNSTFILNLNNYSSLLKVLRITALIKRFVNKMLKRPVAIGPLTAEELYYAKNNWIKFEQKSSFSLELQNLQSGQLVPKESPLFKLAPFLDSNNLIRIKSRLNEGALTDEEAHPVLLPKQSKFTELVIIQEHNKIFHGGVAATLAKIRSKFWIPQGRQIVKKVLRKCLICKKYSLKPAKQITSQLPKTRITENPPFTITGVDFTGPVLTKFGKDEPQKAYIALFTCGVTRALHIELITNMSTKSFILSLRRFLARRGCCKVIISDNAKSFRATNEILKEFSKIITDSKLKDFIAINGITWQYIVPHAPWWGGFYERLMKSIKEPLRKVLGKALLSFEEMMTILSEIELVLNHRPLTYVTNEVGEPQALTPAHFLFPGEENICYPVHFADLFSNEPSNKEKLNRRKMYQTLLLKQLWKKWKENYLLQLRSAHNFQNPILERNLKVGEVVLLEGSTKSKLLWPLGIIEEVYTGRDGCVRSCMIRTVKGRYKRPIQLIYPLEI